MTTNVLDIQNNMMTSDSRWSVESTNAIFFIDDTDFDKMCVNGDRAFMFAGDGLLIQKWKDWAFDENRDTNNLPDVERTYIDGNGKPKTVSISLCGIIMSTRKIYFQRGLIGFDIAKFSGSGRMHAS